MRPHPHIGLATVTYLLIGAAFGAVSPVPTHSPTLYLDIALAAGAGVRIAAAQPARGVLIGGEPLGHRFMGWNFVASRKDAIAQAAEAWAAQPNSTFPQVPGETEIIPLPERRPA